jgi:hypothetical protein
VKNEDGQHRDKRKFMRLKRRAARALFWATVQTWIGLLSGFVILVMLVESTSSKWLGLASRPTSLLDKRLPKLPGQERLHASQTAPDHALGA